MTRPRVVFFTTTAVLLFALLSCRPVFAIGWEEIAAIILLVAFLLGPILWRLARGWSRFQESLKKDRERR